NQLSGGGRAERAAPAPALARRPAVQVAAGVTMTDAEIRAVLSDRLAAVRSRMADACRRAGRDAGAVTLVAVTKSVSPQVAAIAFELGMHDLGESKPQELWKKAEAVPAAKWHLIGHL